MPMNLHAIAGPLVAIITGEFVGVWRRSTGYTTDGPGNRISTYTDVPDTVMRVQALEGEDLRLIEGLDIQGVKRAVWLNGDVKAIDRKTQSGGDLLEFNNATWLVVHVFETWDGSNWCHVAVKKQIDAARTP